MLLHLRLSVFLINLFVKMLIAEDDMDLSHLAETFLLDCGHEVVKTVDASQILPCARREKSDLILLDINMPDGKGGDILVMLKRSRPQIFE